MLERVDEEAILNEFREYLRNNKNLQDKSVSDDITRIRMMKTRNIDYTKGEDYARKLLYASDLSGSSIRSCLRVCRYYQEYFDQRE